MGTQSQDDKEQRQEQSDERQDQSQRKTPPQGGERKQERDPGQDAEVGKTRREQENKSETPKDKGDPGGITPQDDLA